MFLPQSLGSPLFCTNDFFLAIQDAFIKYLSEVTVRKELGVDRPAELVLRTFVVICQHKGLVQAIGHNARPFDY